MKQLKFVACLSTVTVILACNPKKPHPEYVEISGKIINAKSKALSIYHMGGAKKEIAIAEDGSFKDTFKIVEHRNKVQIMLQEDKAMAQLYTENGADMHMYANASDFKNSLEFSLDFSDINNYQNKKSLILSSDIGFNKKTWYRLEKTAFDERMSILKEELLKALQSFSNINPDQVASEKRFIESYIERLSLKYEEEHAFATKLAKGAPSPEFEGYENYDGSKTSLSDFKGKFVFIDVWATWCAPCKYEIPYLEAIEKEYHDKNIVFISMSVDKQKDKTKWRKMIEDKQMSGIQILAPKETSSDFTRTYNINSIPRFILIDPEGKIVDFDAPRPSNKEAITALLSSIK